MRVRVFAVIGQHLELVSGAVTRTGQVRDVPVGPWNLDSRAQGIGQVGIRKIHKTPIPVRLLFTGTYDPARLPWRHSRGDPSTLSQEGNFD